MKNNREYFFTRFLKVLSPFRSDRCHAPTSLFKTTTWLLVAMVIGLYTHAHSQTFALLNNPNTYSFIKYDQNVIRQYSADAMRHVFAQMKRLETKGDRQVEILHIGDSHIQADIFSGEIRENFIGDQRFPTSSRGLLFPYRAAKTNNPSNYLTTYTGTWKPAKATSTKENSRWGLTGITVETTDPNASITLNPNRYDSAYLITKAKIFYPNQDPSSFLVTIAIDTGNFITSIMHGNGYVEYSFYQPQREITLIFKKDNPAQQKFVLQGVSLENNSPGIIYSSTGINGAKVETYFRCEDFDRNLAALNPDLIIVSLGTNDAYYGFSEASIEADYRYLLQKIKTLLPEASVLLTTPGDGFRRRSYPNKSYLQLQEVMHRLAQEMGLALWDFYEVMGGFKSVDEWHKNGLAQRDKLHFTAQGYRLQGQLLYQALNQAYVEMKPYLN